jgi:lipoprotein Spr
MLKRLLFSATILLLLGAFVPAQAQKKGSNNTVKSDVKFLDNISIDVPYPDNAQPVSTEPKNIQAEPQLASKKTVNSSTSSIFIETASSLQFKYALLLNTEVEAIKNLPLFKLIDDWFGTRYRLGGSTKDGIDCSAFMQVLFAGLYTISLPRTAKEQYNFSRKISRSELKEGDLVFFNTVGGISHVGFYLQNNKFVHASSGGVTVSDLDEDYWTRHFIGSGRVDEAQQATVSISKP